jgi:hypothetical protein
MLTGKTNMDHASQHPSLLPLRKALSVAENAAPSRPRWLDANEQRALQLIARMQANYKKAVPFVGLRNVSGLSTHHQQMHEMAGTYAR